MLWELLMNTKGNKTIPAPCSSQKWRHRQERQQKPTHRQHRKRMLLSGEWYPNDAMPANLTLFESRIFADVIKIEVTLDSRGALHPHLLDPECIRHYPKCFPCAREFHCHSHPVRQTRSLTPLYTPRGERGRQLVQGSQLLGGRAKWLQGL